MTPAFSELLWVFTQLPDDYVVLDTETTGLPDENGLPDIVSLGVTVVRQRQIQCTAEFMTKPQKPISAEAKAIHSISDAEAAGFESFGAQCREILEHLTNQLVVIHNASFDWPILIDHVARANSNAPVIKGVFCSQKAATPWAQSRGLPCSSRGPSLDTLTEALGVTDMRRGLEGIHSAGNDSQQAALVVERLRVCATRELALYARAPHGPSVESQEKPGGCVG
jgi:DNA polymerase-3 subunit epsilon